MLKSSLNDGSDLYQILRTFEDNFFGKCSSCSLNSQSVVIAAIVMYTILYSFLAEMTILLHLEHAFPIVEKLCK